jgi:hypothetical protein
MDFGLAGHLFYGTRSRSSKARPVLCGTLDLIAANIMRLLTII